jgi:hypothetical protein
MKWHEECQGIQSQILTNIVFYDYVNVRWIENHSKAVRR